MGVHIRFHAGTGRSALLFMLVAFVLTFVVTRLVVRMIRSGRGPFGNMDVDGVHIHHLVPGIFLMLVVGPLEFTLTPQGTVRDLMAALFGVGAALTLDEFALWLHLTDVYWEQEGRKSVDAVVGVACLGLLGLFASNPFSRQRGESPWFFVGLLALQVGLALTAVLKGRLVLGVGGLLVPFLSLFGALRLARPGSPWFRWFYPEDSPKTAKATRRAARHGMSGRVKAMISGLPKE